MTFLKWLFIEMIDVIRECTQGRRKYCTALYWILCAVLAAAVWNGHLFWAIFIQGVGTTPLLWAMCDDLSRYLKRRRPQPPAHNSPS